MPLPRGPLRSLISGHSLRRIRGWPTLPRLPRPCAVCGEPGGRHPVCSWCRPHLPGLLTPRCVHCALRLPPCHRAEASTPGPGNDPFSSLALPAPRTCDSCLTDSPRHRILAAADYAYPIDGVVIALKFGGQVELADALGWLCALACLPPAQQAVAGALTHENGTDAGQGDAASAWQRDNGLIDADLIDDIRPTVVPVPLGRDRLESRGFNHAALIAGRFVRHLEAMTGLRLAVDGSLVERQRSTLPQSRLRGRRARFANVAGAFEASSRAEGRHVLLVDDAVTSGATSMACADALVQAGAQRVTIVAATRTPNPGPPQHSTPRHCADDDRPIDA